MANYNDYYENRGSPYRPDWVPSSSPDDKVGMIAVCKDRESLVTELLWAYVDKMDKMSLGTVVISWGGASDESLDQRKRRLYAKAARALNRRLKNVLIEKTVYSPSWSPETSFYETAQVKPSWKRVGAGAFAIFDELRIRLPNGAGFRPFLQPRYKNTDDSPIIAEIVTYRALRQFRQTVPVEGVNSGDDWQKDAKHFCDVVPS